MLLLFGASQAGLLGAAAAVVTLTAPVATIEAGDVVLEATACELALTVPAATQLGQVLTATACELAFTAPPATTAASGTAVVQASACVLTLSSGQAGVSLDLTTRIVIIGGAVRTGHIRGSSLVIVDELNEAPNTCGFVADGFVPVAGQEILVAIGTLTNKLFAGHLTRVTQIYEGQRRELVAYQCEAVDYTRLLDRRFVHRRYGAQSVTAIVQDILARDTSGFTGANVATGLPAITEIEFVWELPSRALSRLAQLIGAYWYVDYNRDVHVFISEVSDAPDPILEGDIRIETLARTSDTNQIRTCVIVEGEGSRASADVAVGATLIPVEDATPYASGLVKSGPQRVSYTGVVVGGGGTTVRGVAAPTGWPWAAIAPQAGGVLGPVDYRVSFKNDLGETVPGGTSNTVTGVVFANASPPGTPTVSAIPNVIGVLVGAYSYRVSYVTAKGETVVGGIGSRTAAAVAVPSVPAGSATGVGPLIGTYGYRVTFVTPYGDTTGGAVLTLTAAVGSWAGSFLISTSSVGPLIGTYNYAITYITPYGETFGAAGPVNLTTVTSSAPSVSTTGGGLLIDYATTYVHPIYGESARSARTTANTTTFVVSVNGLPTGCGWNLYSSGSNASGGPLYKVAELGVGVPSFTHQGETGPHGQIRPTLGRALLLSSIEAGPAGTTARRIYRTRAGGTAYYPIAQIANGVTSFLDTIPDQSLTGSPPTDNTNGRTHTLTVPLGPTGTLARRIYRTKAGGSSYSLVGELPNNSATTFVDAVPDDALTAGIPVLATAGGQQHRVTLPLGPAGTLARRLYRTSAGGSDFKRLAEVQDNSSGFYDDNIPDAALTGDGPVLVSTAGASSVELTSIPIGGAGITARRIYRRDSLGNYRFVAEIKDNVTTTFLDDLAEKELGEVAPTESTIGANIGETTLLVESTAPFQAGGGWAYLGSQEIRYTGIGDRMLTGIPTSGPGALLTPVRTGTEILAASLLTGIPASGEGALLYALTKGDPVNVLVEAHDLAAQAALAALEGGDGRHDHFLSDSTLTRASCQTRATAELQQFAPVEQRLTFASRDEKLRSGKSVVIALGPPTNIAGTYKIQQVTISQFHIPGLAPLRTVVASTYLYSLEHLFRRVELGA